MSYPLSYLSNYSKLQVMSGIKKIEQAVVEALLSAEARQQYTTGKIGRRHLEPYAAAIKNLSAYYTGQESWSSMKELSAIDAGAYALYYLPINYFKITHLLRYLPVDFFEREIAVLDVGCGPGTATAAILEKTRKISLACGIERSGAMRALAGRIVPRLLPPSRPFELCGRIEELPQTSTFDLIVLANVLNELRDGQDLTLLARCYERLRQDGVLLILEPALQRTTRAHMQRRDQILAQFQDLNPLFPCTHRTSCPMLSASPNDWCHGTLGWKEPQVVAQLDEITGFNKHRIKFAALVLQRRAPSDSGYRVVSEPGKNKVAYSATLCGADFYGEVKLPRREKSESNQSFCQIEHYDLVHISNGAISPSLTSEVMVSRDDGR